MDYDYLVAFNYSLIIEVSYILSPAILQSLSAPLTGDFKVLLVYYLEPTNGINFWCWRSMIMCWLRFAGICSSSKSLTTYLSSLGNHFGISAWRCLRGAFRRSDLGGRPISSMSLSYSEPRSSLTSSCSCQLSLSDSSPMYSFPCSYYRDYAVSSVGRILLWVKAMGYLELRPTSSLSNSSKS